MRNSHTHRNLFYHEDYPDSIPNFADRSIHPALARELAFEASRVLPILGDPTPGLVRSFSENLGWELRESPRPVVNLWTRMTVSEGQELHSYVVGGVMLMGVSSQGEGDAWVEYLTPGQWIGPVVKVKCADGGGQTTEPGHSPSTDDRDSPAEPS